MTLETVHGTEIPSISRPVFEESVNRVLDDIIHPSQFYAASNAHVPRENNSITRTHVAEDVFITMDMPGDNERDDDASGEFEHVEASRRDVIGNTDTGVPESVEGSLPEPTGTFVAPPSLDEAQLALDNLKKLLCPLRTSHAEHGRYKDPGMDSYLRTQLEEMKQFLWTYVNPQSTVYDKWTAASLHTANNLEKKPYHARILRERVRAFMVDPEDLPHHPYGAWSESVLDCDKTLAQDIHLHLQKIGKYVRAEDLVDFMDTPEM